MELIDLISAPETGAAGADRLRVYRRSAASRDLTAFDKTLWAQSIRKRMTDLLALPSGWDGYQAPRIPHETAIYSAQILQELWQHGIPAPQISPLSDGGLVVEWQGNGIELTLEIERPYCVTMIHYDEGKTTEEVLGRDLAPFSRRLVELRQPLMQVSAA